MVHRMNLNNLNNLNMNAKIEELLSTLKKKEDEKEKNTVLCPDCEELLRYAHTRLDRCPFGEKKSSCKKCTVHCYKPVMRERMRQTMRFAGPRMIFYSPWAAIRHLLNL